MTKPTPGPILSQGLLLVTLGAHCASWQEAQGTVGGPWTPSGALTPFGVPEAPLQGQVGSAGDRPGTAMPWRLKSNPSSTGPDSELCVTTGVSGPLCAPRIRCHEGRCPDPGKS